MQIRRQLSVIHLSLVNEIKHGGKSTLSISTPSKHKYPFQSLKIKNPFSLRDIKIQKKVGEKSVEKLFEKAKKEEVDRV